MIFKVIVFFMHFILQNTFIVIYTVLNFEDIYNYKTNAHCLTIKKYLHRDNCITYLFNIHFNNKILINANFRFVFKSNYYLILDYRYMCFLKL